MSVRVIIKNKIIYQGLQAKLKIDPNKTRAYFTHNTVVVELYARVVRAFWANDIALVSLVRLPATLGMLPS